MSVITNRIVLGQAGNDNFNFLLDTDIAGALRFRRGVTGAGGTVLNISNTGALSDSTGSAFQRIKLLTAKELSGLTSVDFLPTDGIPSWAKEITVTLSNVSTNGTANPMLLLGTVAGMETSGYSSTVNSTAFGPVGFGVGFGTAAASVLNGLFTLSLHNGTTWVYSGAPSYSGITGTAGGQKVLAGPLDRVRLTTFYGTELFDSGTWNLLIKG